MPKGNISEYCSLLYLPRTPSAWFRTLKSKALFELPRVLSLASNVVFETKEIQKYGRARPGGPRTPYNQLMPTLMF